MSVPLIGPDGQKYTLTNDDPAALEKAREDGFHVEGETSPHDIAEQQAQAAEVGMARGATFGLSDVALGEGGAEEQKSLKRLQEEHPVASGLGELAGAVLSPVNKVGALVEGPRAATLAGRLGQKVLGGAAVGSLYGAGQTVSDASLGDPELTADKLIGHVGLGAILGGLGGGLGGAVEEAVAGVVPKLARSTSKAQSILDEVANDATVKATRATQTEINRIGEANIQELGGVLRDRGHLSSSPEKILETVTGDREAQAQAVLKQLGLDVELPHGFEQEEAKAALAKALDKAGERVGAALEGVDASAQFPGGARPSYSEILKRIDELEASALDPAAADVMKGPISKVRGYLNEMGSRPVNSSDNGFRALNSLKSSLTRDINYGAESSAKVDVQKRLAGIIRSEIDAQLERSAGAGVSEEFLKAKQAYGILSRGEDALGRKTSTAADAIAEMARAGGLTSPEAKLFEQLGHAQSLASKGMGRAGGVGLKDLGLAIVGGGFHPSIGIVAGLGHKLLREYGPVLIAKTAGALAKSEALGAVATSFAKSLPTRAPQLGVYGPALMNAASKSAESALATHMVLAQVDPNYAATAQTAGLTPEDPATHAASLERAHGVVQVGAAAAEASKAIERHLDSVMKGSGGPAAVSAHGSQDFGTKRMRRDPQASHAQAVKEVRELARNPQALVDRVAKNLADVGPVAPAVSAALTARAQVAVQYLTQHAAVPPPAGPMAREHVPSDADVFSHSRRLAVVRQPVQAIMSHAARGTLTRADMDTLKAVYPSLAKEIGDKALERVAEGKKDVPYKSRMMLSILTGIDVDGTTSPAAIRANQMAMQAQPQKPQDMKKPDASALKGAERMGTPSQKREMQGREA
jgi:hypothetical protein